MKYRCRICKKIGQATHCCGRKCDEYFDFHIKEWPRSRFERVVIVGKGPSYYLWPRYDMPNTLLISCNSVIEKVKKGILVQRDAGPIFKITDDIIVIGPKAVVESYGYGIWYSWDDIPKVCSGFTALYIADMLTDQIVMVGFDNLNGMSSDYHPDFPQGHERGQWVWGLQQQREAWEDFPQQIKEKVTLV